MSTIQIYDRFPIPHFRVLTGVTLEFETVLVKTDKLVYLLGRWFC